MRPGPNCRVHVSALVDPATELVFFRIKGYPLVAFEFRGADSSVALHLGTAEITRIRAELNKAELELTLLQTGPDIRESAAAPDERGGGVNGV